MKWKLPLILCLVESPELKDLELNEFIKRNVHPTRRPVTIIYEATAYSRTLKNVLRELTA
jgi:DNA-binding HxlR family transcriptional regulator